MALLTGIGIGVRVVWGVREAPFVGALAGIVAAQFVKSTNACGVRFDNNRSEPHARSGPD